MDGFDRVVFRFGEGTFPGYNLEWAHEAPVDCQSQQPAQIGGTHFLRLRLRSVEDPQRLVIDLQRPQASGN